MAGAEGSALGDSEGSADSVTLSEGETLGSSAPFLQAVRVNAMDRASSMASSFLCFIAGIPFLFEFNDSIFPGRGCGYASPPGG